jgi:hypothetical protein
MSDILKKLEEETRRIEYEKKREYGTLLTEDEIKNIFELLKKEDLELKPILELIEKNLQFLPEDQYMIKEETIKSILTYYKILENSDFLNIRHKLFFTESKVMVKKPYFSPETTEKIKENIKTIFQKI